MDTRELTASLSIRMDDPANLPEGFNAHVFPDGEFAAEDGRPANMGGCRAKAWRIDAAIGEKLAAMASAEKPILYDYEHNSATGKGSRAAGWIDKLAYVPGKGLFAHVDWTPQAADAIAKKEYRFSSPFFSFDAKTGAISRLYSVALTNTPALDCLSAVGLQRQPPGDTPMDDDQNVAALTTLRDTLQTQLTSLTAERDALKAQVAALESEKAAAAQEAEKKAAAALEAEKEALLSAAAAKLTPPLKESLKELSVDALKTALAALPASPLTNKQTDGNAGVKDKAAQLTAEEKAMCARMGVSAEDFLKARAADAVVKP